MSTPEHPDFYAEPKPPADDPQVGERVADLEQRVNSQRLLLQLTLGCILLLAAVLNVFFYQQVRILRGQTWALNQNIKELGTALGDYQTNTWPWMQHFAVDMTQFASSHADFKALISKYDLTGAAPKPTNAPVAPKR